MKNLNYLEEKIKSLTMQSSTRIYGVTLSTQNDPKKFLVIKYCGCLQKNEESKCNCTHEDAIIWIPSDKIIESGAANKKNSNDEEMEYYEIEKEVTVFIETVRSVKIGEFITGDFQGTSPVYRMRNPFADVTTAGATCKNLSNLISIYEKLINITNGWIRLDPKFAQAYHDAKEMFDQLNCQIF